MWDSSSPDTDISTRARTPTTVASTPTATPKKNQDSFTTLYNDSMTEGASASTKASTIVASEDMALLGAKLQTIDGSVNSSVNSALSSTNTLHRFGYTCQVLGPALHCYIMLSD